MKKEYLILFLAIFLGLMSCYKQSKMEKFNLTKMQSIPKEFGTISKGVSASFIGSLDDVLIVGGGCNFPNTPVADGGKKVYYKEILGYKNGEWKKLGELPQPIAYGISTSKNDTLFWLGGQNNEQSFDTIYKLYFENDALQVKTLCQMPFTANNFSATFLANEIYVFGGVQNHKPSNQFWKYNLENKKWSELLQLPDRALQQANLVTVKNDLYLFGGFDIPRSLDSLTYVSENVWKYSVVKNEWELISTYPKTEENNSLSGGCAVAISDRYILTFGGVNKTIFEKAVDGGFLLKNGNLDSEKRKELEKESKEYLKHPISWYQFNPMVSIFDTKENKWEKIEESSNTALAGAVVCKSAGKVFIFNGEVKPGIRTPKVWYSKLGDYLK